MKHIALLSLSLTLFFTGYGESIAKPEPDLLVPKVELAGSKVQPFVYAKTIALPKLLQKATMIAQAIRPNPENAAIPLMAGTALGDPSLVSVDPKRPVSFFLFDVFEDDPAFVLVAKLKQDSPIRKTLEGADFTIADKDGWTLATQTPKLFNQVKDWSALLAFARVAPSTDVEFGVRLDPMRKHLQKIKGTINEGLAGSPFEEDTQTSLGKVIEVALDEVATMDSMKINLLLSNKEIITRTTFAAQKGTALAKLFSTKAGGGKVSAAQYLEPGGWMTMVLDWNMENFMAYYEHVGGKLKGSFEGEFKELLERLDTLTVDWTKAYGGPVAMRYDLAEKEGAMNFVQIGSTELTPEAFAKMITDYSALTQEMMEKIDLFEEAGMKYKFKSGKGKPVKGIPTHRFSMKMEADPELFPGGLPFSEMNYHFAVVDGHYVTTSDRKELGRLIRSLKKGKSVKNSLAQTLALQPGQMARWSFDVGKYAEFVTGMTGVLDEESMQELVDGIRKLDLVPITGSMSLGSGRFKSDVRIPLKTIKAGIGIMEKAQAGATPQVPQ